MSLPDDPSPLAQKLLKAAAASPTPMLLMDLNRVEAQFHALRTALPEAKILYALKANPGREVLSRLAALGCGFDMASPGELERCRSLDGPNVFLSHGNPIKKEADTLRRRDLVPRNGAPEDPVKGEQCARFAL
jgi:ornithine decarboxylase